jgi:hypothetical protein
MLTANLLPSAGLPTLRFFPWFALILLEIATKCLLNLNSAFFA